MRWPQFPQSSGPMESAACDRSACQKARRPGPLEVEATDAAVAVEDLSDQIEARRQLGFHRPEIDLFERYSTSCDLGIVPASIVFDWEFELGQRGKQAISVFSRQLRDRCLGITFDVGTERLGTPFRYLLRPCLQQ